MLIEQTCTIARHNDNTRSFEFDLHFKFDSN